MPYLGYLLAQALKAGDTIAQAITSAASYVTKVGGSVVDLSPSVEAIKSPSEGSAVFNGTSDYINLGQHTPDSLGISDSFSIGAWAYHTNHTNYKSILTMWNNGSSRMFWFGIDSSELFHYNISLTGGDRARNVISIPVNQWSYLNLTYDGSNIRLFLNGNLVDTQAATGTLDGRGGDLTENLLIGAQDTYSVFYLGNLSNVALWSRALSASEIRSVMNKSYDELNASETKGLVSWYALDDISGSTVPDSHGNYNGTAN